MEVVAIKITRGVGRYLKAAYREIQILLSLKQVSAHGTIMIALKDYFILGPHLCIVFPLYGPSLHLLQATSPSQIGIDEIRDFAWQILSCLKRTKD